MRSNLRKSTLLVTACGNSSMNTILRGISEGLSVMRSRPILKVSVAVFMMERRVSLFLGIPSFKTIKA